MSECVNDVEEYSSLPCDDEPEEPRKRTPREIYEEMEREYWQKRLIGTFGKKKTSADICCCVRRTVYPDGRVIELACDRPVFRQPGWEDASQWDAVVRPRSSGETDKQANIARAMRRARALVRDLALSNDMAYFVTLTLDGSRIDRQDPAALVAQINRFCRNRVARQGLAYILVPERHKDGSFHMHGFVNGSVRVVDSGTAIPPDGGKPRKPRSARQREQWLAAGGHIVYNLPDWDVGFTTAIQLYGERTKAVEYVCKYIGKQLDEESGLPEKIGGRWVYHGGCPARPSIEVVDMPFDDVILTEKSWAWYCDSLGCTFIRTEFSL